MLQKQTITIPLGLGVNTKADEKLVEQGQFNLVCENATFKKVGAVQKRQAYKTMSTTYYTPGSTTGTNTGNYTALSNPPTMSAALGKSVFLRNKVGAYLYSHADDFIYKPTYPIPECKVTTTRVYSTKTSVDQTDSTYDSDEDIILAACRSQALSTSDGVFGLVIFDNTNKTTVSVDAQDAVDTGFTRAGVSRVAGISYYYHVYVNSSGALKVDIYDKNGQNPGAQLSQANVGKYPIAICRHSDNSACYVIVPTTTANTGRILKLSGTSISQNQTFTYSGSSWKSATARFNAATSEVYFAYMTGGNQVRQIVFNASAGVATADAALTNATANGSNTSVSYRQDSTNLFINDDETLGTDYRVSGYVPGLTTKYTENFNTWHCSDMVDLSGVKCALAIDRLGSETNFGIGSSQDYAGTTVFARLAQGAGLSLAHGQLTRMCKISSTVAAVAHPVASHVVGAGVAYTMALTFFEIGQDYKSGSRSILGKNLHFNGGFGAEFDGETLFENGFHLPPSAPIVSNSSAGNLTGTFFYKAVLKWVDKNGQVTRSAPSAGLVSTGAIASKQSSITIKSMPFGVKGLACIVEFYRASTTATNYQYCGEARAAMYGNELAFTTPFVDNTADISANAFLYTTGGVLENNPAPAGKFVFQGGDRVFLGGLDDDNELAYSKKKLFGECTNFNDDLRIRFDSAQFNILGGLTAGGYMDGKIIGFKRNSIFCVTGDGPLETGLDNTFSDPELVSAETGCTEPRSVVMGPEGIFFKGDKGIYLLTRGLTTEYIGSGVEEFNTYNVTSACHVDKKNQVVFTVASSDTSKKYMLAYDYYTKQWSVNYGKRCLDGDVVDSDHLILDSASSAPMVQNGSDFLDDSSYQAMRVKTPWIKLSGVQDFARIWRLYILGTFKSAHTLTVMARYDYDSSYVETFAVAPNLSDAQYQYAVHLIKQKCEAVQFEIYDANQSGTGESMELTALTLEVGIRKGAMKLPAARKY